MNIKDNMGKSRLAHWFSFLRIANSLTVPGAVFIGGSLSNASSGLIIITVLIYCLIYIASIGLNNLCDINEDLKERPERELPSGKISIPSARIIVFLLYTLAVIFIILSQIIMSAGIFHNIICLAVLLISANDMLR